MTNVVDRRGQAGTGSVSRQRALDRSSRHVKKAIDKAITDGKGFRDLGKDGIEVVVPKEDLSQPIIHHGQGGVRDQVHPGNKKYHVGDTFDRQSSGGGGGGSKASDSGEGEDDFVFKLSEEEFFNYLFKDLELPNLEQRKDADITRTKLEYAGIVSDGPQNKLDMARSKRKKMGRMIAAEKPYNDDIIELLSEERDILRAYNPTVVPAFKAANKNLPVAWVPRKEKIKKLEREINSLKAAFGDALSLVDQLRINEIEEQVDEAQKGKHRIPSWNESTDLKYRLHTRKPQPNSRAVMVCVMDVSGSMDENRKGNAKLFYALLYRFLMKNYKKVDVVFIRHHTTAKEVEEDDFFHGRESGGTVVSSGLKLMHEVIKDRYGDGSWNIYGAQASDGDNWAGDSEVCVDLMREILPMLQGYFYTEVTEGEPQDLWENYKTLAREFPDRFWMQGIKERKDIWPVFRELFKKRGANGQAVSPARLAMA